MEQSDPLHEAIHGRKRACGRRLSYGPLVALMVGRFVTTPLMKYIPPSRMLGIYGAAKRHLDWDCDYAPEHHRRVCHRREQFLFVDYVSDYIRLYLLWA